MILPRFRVSAQNIVPMRLHPLQITPTLHRPVSNINIDTTTPQSETPLKSPGMLWGMTGSVNNRFFGGRPMGHDAGHLIFWKPVANTLDDPAGLLRSLEASPLPAVLDDIDQKAVFAALKQTYRSFKPPQPVELDFPKQETAITITWSAKHFAFFFEGDAFKQMDRVSLLMSNLGLACYDVLADRQFTSDAPPRFIGSPDEEARWKMYEKVGMERRNALLAEMGFPVDPKTDLSPGMRELLRTDPEKFRKINNEFMKRVTAVTTGPEVWAEVDRRMALRTARQAKKSPTK